MRTNCRLVWYAYLTEVAVEEAVLAEEARKAEEAAIAEELRQEFEAEHELLKWLADPANYDDENYSDIFKDVWGFRPRNW